MHVKLGLLSGLVAAASASTLNYGQVSSNQIGKQYSHEYIQPNVEEVCFSVRPVASCDEQHVATQVKHQKVGFHCLNKALPITKQFQRQTKEGQQLPLENKSQDIQAFVEVPVNCERINSEEKRLRKQTEKTTEQKIHLVQQQDGEEDSFLFEQKPWVSTYDIQKERIARKHNQLKNVEEEEWINDEELDTMNKYDVLINKRTSMHTILSMSEHQFHRLMESLKFIAHQSVREDQWSQQLDQTLPNVFSKVAKQFFETVLAKKTVSQIEKEELYEQYKEIVKRIYAYVVKQTLQMKNLRTSGLPIRENQTTELARNLWFKIQRELTPRQIQEVQSIASNIEQSKPKLERMVEENLDVVNREQYKQLEKQLTKVLTAGLTMVNHRDIKEQGEEYKKYHGEQYENEFRTQYPKLYQRLSNINDYQQWRI